MGDTLLTEPQIMYETTKKIMQIREHLKSACSHQKSYANIRCKALEFQVGDKFMPKVSPWKEFIRFGKRVKLNPIYIGSFEILVRIALVTY